MRNVARRPTKAAGTAALTALALAVAANAAAAPPIAGGRYAGHSTQRGVVDFRVGPAGERITQYVLTGRFTCNAKPFRGGRYHWRVGPQPHGAPEPPIVVHADGTFAMTVHTHQPVRAPNGTVRQMRGSYRLAGRFDPATGKHGTARGTLRALLTSPDGLRCDSGVRRWSARGAA